MAVTNFGRAVRKARQETNDTLMTMSKGLSKSVAFLSAIETGRTKIPLDLIPKIESFFNQKGYVFNEDLNVVASVANENIPIDGLSYQHQMMVAGFANSNFNREDLDKICSLLDEIKKAKEVLNDRTDL